MNGKKLKAFISKEVSLSRSLERKGDIEKAKTHLGRAHLLSQKHALYHVYIHFLMLFFAVRNFDLNEILGQTFRIIVTVPGHSLGKVPKGNIGWASVGLTEEMDIPEDLKLLLNELK
jgi:hypothetical protein